MTSTPENILTESKQPVWCKNVDLFLKVIVIKSKSMSKQI